MAASLKLWLLKKVLVALFIKGYQHQGFVAFFFFRPILIKVYECENKTLLSRNKTTKTWLKGKSQWPTQFVKSRIENSKSLAGNQR